MMKEKFITYLSNHIDIAREKPEQAHDCYIKCYGVMCFLIDLDPDFFKDQEIVNAWEQACLYFYEYAYGIKFGYRPQ